MRLIQKYLPRPKHTEVNRIFVNAKPEEAWETARHFDASRIPWIRLLFDLRTLPDIIGGRSKEFDTRLGIDQIAESGSGFFIAEEIPGREIVVASIGQFWHLHIPFYPVSPVNFATFSEPGWGKLAWSISVEPYREGSTLCLELRTTATDEDSWRKLNHYYSVIGIGSQWIREAAMAHMEKKLGKMHFESKDKRPLPGDELLPESIYQQTFQINIEAPVSIVWAYLMQLGCDRGGWYSIDQLDHGGVPSTDHIVETWPERKPGERIAATPKKDSFFEVYTIIPNQVFTIGGETTRINRPFAMNWTFLTEPIGEDTTHLISRARMEAEPQWAEWIMGQLLYPVIHGLMSGVQLKTLKKYAEKEALKRTWLPEPAGMYMRN